MIVYLIGFMGSGKSTAGKKLASSLGWLFIDMDKEIEHRYGRLIHDIFEEKGEEYFRKIESDVLRDLAFSDDIVISCGGGTPCYNNNMDFMLANGLTIYLKMEAEQLKSRLENSHSVRPLLKNIEKENLVFYIASTLEKREPWYKRSELIVEGLDIDILSLKNLILEKLNH